jgi:hypothetical protein
LQGESTPANITPPDDPDGKAIAASGPFSTQFYPGVTDPNNAKIVTLAAGDRNTGIDFAVQSRAAVGISSVRTYGYYGQQPVAPAPLVGPSGGTTVVAAGPGLMNSSYSALAPGLRVNVLGNSGAMVLPDTVMPYTGAFIQFGVRSTFGWSRGPRHLVFSTADDLYVLPAGLFIVDKAPPVIDSVTPSGDSSDPNVLISGSNFDSATRILFDGAPASIVRRADDGSLLVVPPPGNPAERANLIAVNSDGQSSAFLQMSSVPTYDYPGGAAPSIALDPSSLPAGAESMVEITGVDTRFSSGQTVLGFGTSDIHVRRATGSHPGECFRGDGCAAGLF